MHRFRRVRLPLLLRPAAAGEAGAPRLLRLLKPLLKPEFASLVESIDEPSAVLRALLATDAGVP